MAESSDIYSAIDGYIAELFVPPDDVLESALNRAKSSGLPEIQVTATQGKFLYLLAKLASARRILEIGTLGGYSTIWLARALPEGGTMVTLELDPRHAKLAEANIAQAGLSHKVQIVVGSAHQTLLKVCDAASAPFDLVFLDADKAGYTSYFTQVMRVVHSGSLILADNVIREGAVLAPRESEPADAAVRSFNATIAADDRLEAVILQQVGVKGHDGLAIARVK